MKRSTVLLLSILIILTISGFETYFILLHYKNHRDDANIINQAGIIRGSIQRVSKLSLYNKKESTRDSEKIINSIDQLIINFKEEADKFKLQGHSEDFKGFIIELDKHWSELKNNIAAYRKNPTLTNKTGLIEKSEYLWEIADNVTLKAQKYSEEKIRSFFSIIPIAGINILMVLLLGIMIQKYVKNELEFLANYDILTRSLNRQSYATIIKKEAERCNRYTCLLSLIVLDIDDFKKINDTYGHKTGDIVLTELSDLIRNKIRAGDYLFRIGGEEFAILLTNTEVETGTSLAERIRMNIKKNKFSEACCVTVSMGLAGYIKDEGVDSFFRRADSSLYQAKKDGKNRVHLINQSHGEKL
ncbi:MAG: GGDEF domain-containing protein [Actinomycetia bacterium]|nr:GGDEF domain-containing protein [Actinomycetes bacterium]